MAKTEQGNGLDVRGSTEKLTDTERGDQEINGNAVPGESPVDKYGFIGGAQQQSEN